MRTVHNGGSSQKWTLWKRCGCRYHPQLANLRLRRTNGDVAKTARTTGCGVTRDGLEPHPLWFLEFLRQSPNGHSVIVRRSCALLSGIWLTACAVHYVGDYNPAVAQSGRSLLKKTDTLFYEIQEAQHDLSVHPTSADVMKSASYSAFKRGWIDVKGLSLWFRRGLSVRNSPRCKLSLGVPQAGIARF
jgi:hypothetical protein